MKNVGRHKGIKNKYIIVSIQKQTSYKRLNTDFIYIHTHIPFLLLECYGEQRVPIRVFQIFRNKLYNFLFSEAQREHQNVRINNPKITEVQQQLQHSNWKGLEPVNHEAVLLMLKTSGNIQPPVECRVKVKHITWEDIYICETKSDYMLKDQDQKVVLRKYK